MLKIYLLRWTWLQWQHVMVVCWFVLLHFERTLFIFFSWIQARRTANRQVKLMLLLFYLYDFTTFFLTYSRLSESPSDLILTDSSFPSCQNQLQAHQRRPPLYKINLRYQKHLRRKQKSKYIQTADAFWNDFITYLCCCSSPQCVFSPVRSRVEPLVTWPTPTETCYIASTLALPFLFVFII